MDPFLELRQGLLSLGFDEVRYTAIPSDNERAQLEVAALRAWLDAGNHADMQWIERGFEKRASPALILPDAESMIVLGVNYLPPEPQTGAADGERPVWARYAQYSDYHDTMKPALEKAGLLIEEKLGLGPRDYRYYVDTGPVLERSWAARSGIGFIGKNAMMISREHGNWLFLAAILVRAKLPPDDPLPPVNHCGKCTRCLDACPTGAIVRPGVVDARLCISYQTIENKGAIPRELRKKIGSRIYGCDICAEVCPWNRFAQASRSILLDARPEIQRFALVDLLALTPETFAAHFRKTPIKRLKLTGLLRNACIVAGNKGADAHDCLPQLVRLAAHDSPLVRAHAVWAAFQIAGPARAPGLLATAREAETDAAVLEEYEESEKQNIECRI